MPSQQDEERQHGERAPAIASTQTRATTAPPNNRGEGIVMNEAKGILKRVRLGSESTVDEGEEQLNKAISTTTIITPDTTTNKTYNPINETPPPLTTVLTHVSATTKELCQKWILTNNQNQGQTLVAEEENRVPTSRGMKATPDEEGEQKDDHTLPPAMMSIDQIHEAFDMQFGREEEGVWSTTDLTFAPTPEDGFPGIHGVCMLWQAEGIDKKEFLSWLSLPGLKVITQIFSENSWQTPRATVLNEALCTIMGKHFDEEDVSVLYGFSSWHLRDKHSPPTYIAYTTFRSPPHKSSLKKESGTQWSYTSPYTASKTLKWPTFLGSFKGLTNTQPSKLSSVREGIIQAWEENGVVKIIESLLKAKIKGEDGVEPKPKSTRLSEVHL